MEHTSHRDDVFYCYYVKTDTVLSFYSDTKNFFIGKKKKRLLVPKFYHNVLTQN